MFKNRANQVRAGWLILLAFFAMFVGQQLFSIPGSIALIFVESSILSEPSINNQDMMSLLDTHPWISFFTLGGGVAGAILVTFLFWRFVNKRSMKELGFRGSLTDLGYGLFLGAVSIVVIFFILLLTGNITLTNSFSSPQFSAYTISFLFIYILVGFSEEMFFRGYVMSTMAHRGNRKWVIYVVSALVFSLAHGANPNVSILGLVNIALVGILFAYMFDATDSLWLPIGYHITWNFFQGNIFGFAVSGTTPNGIYNVDVANGMDLLTGGAFGLEGGLLATLLILVGFIATKFYVKSKG